MRTDGLKAVLLRRELGRLASLCSQPAHRKPESIPSSGISGTNGAIQRAASTAFLVSNSSPTIHKKWGQVECNNFRGQVKQTTMDKRSGGEGGGRRPSRRISPQEGLHSSPAIQPVNNVRTDPLLERFAMGGAAVRRKGISQCLKSPSLAFDLSLFLDLSLSLDPKTEIRAFRRFTFSDHCLRPSPSTRGKT